jgi:hypothetical protein
MPKKATTTKKTKPLWFLLGIAVLLLIIIGVLMWRLYYSGVRDSCAGEGNTKYNCLLTTASEKGDVRYCDFITDATWKDICISEAAQKKGNAEACNAIVDNATKDSCLMQINAAKGIYACTNLSTLTWRDVCFAKLASTTLNETHCLGIWSNLARFKCAYDIAMNTSRIEPCGIISTTEIKDDCYVDVAKKTLDMTTCLRINNDSKQDNCYFIMSYHLDSPEACDAIKDAGMQSICFLNLAVSRNDSSYCEKVFLVKAHDECLQRTTGYSKSQ